MTVPTSPRRRGLPHPLLTPLAALLVAACGRAPEAFGTTPEAGRANAAEFFGAFGTRFHEARREGTLDAIHRRFKRDALHPSRLFRDSSLWTSIGIATHVSVVVGATAPRGGYSLAQTRGIDTAHAPAAPGDIRIVNALTRLSDNEYQWDSSADFALGRLTARDLIAGFAAALRELETGDDDAIRARMRETLPRARRAWGVAFTVDSIRTAPRAADGATLVDLVIGLHPDRLRARYPAFGKYFADYVSPARYRLGLAARDGARFAVAAGGGDRLALRFAVKDGALVSFDTPGRALPDSLLLAADVFARIFLFEVGMSGLVAHFTLDSRPRAAGLSIVWRDEPHWHLPLGTRRLVGGALARPFAGQGASLELEVIDAPADSGRPTILARRARLVVQESAILRFLSRLGGRAADDFDERVDHESNRFIAEAFGALARDVAGGPE